MRECKRIQSALAAGHNLVLTGPFGIGRTALLRHLAKQMNEDWRFIFLDGSQTPARLLRGLIQKWAPKRPGTSRRTATAWKVERRHLATLRSPDPRPVVVVLDDVAKVTRPQLDLIRWLKDDGRFRIIAVTERFLPEDGQRRLRARLYPAPLLTLGPLPPPHSQEVLRDVVRPTSPRMGLRPHPRPHPVDTRLSPGNAGGSQGGPGCGRQPSGSSDLSVFRPGHTHGPASHDT